MKRQQVQFTFGNVRFTLAIGDENGNGVVDVSLGVRLIGVFELPKLIVDLSAENAKKLVDGFEAIKDALSKKK